MAAGIWGHWYHSLSRQGGSWQFFSCILWVAEKNAQTNKNERYVWQNSVEGTLRTKGHVLRLHFANSFVKNVFVNHTFLLPQHKSPCLLVQPCCQCATALCFCLFLDVSAHLLWPVCKSFDISQKFLPEWLSPVTWTLLKKSLQKNPLLWWKDDRRCPHPELPFPVRWDLTLPTSNCSLFLLLSHYIKEL